MYVNMEKVCVCVCVDVYRLSVAQAGVAVKNAICKTICYSKIFIKH